MGNTLIGDPALRTPSLGLAEATGILRSLAEHVKRQPKSIAFRDLGNGDQEREAIRFDQLATAAVALGDQLRGAVSRDASETAPLAVLQFSPGIDYITALFGCWCAGVTAVPAYLPRSSRHSERLAAILDDCRPDYILTAPDQVDRVDEVRKAAAPGACLIEHAAQHRPPAPFDEPMLLPTVGPNLADPALIQYTSGSTGSPKGVVVTHGNLLHNVEAILAGLPNRPTVAVSWLPPYHDMGLISKILLPIHTGIESVLMSPFGFTQRPFRWLKAISDYRGSFSGAPDSAYDLCCRRVTEAEKRRLDLSSWQVAFNGSEPVRDSTIQRFSDTFRSCGFRAHASKPVYGLAEATLCATIPEVAAQPRTIAREDGSVFVSCGKPVDDMTIKIAKIDPASPSAEPVPAEEGEEGEIWISGPSVALGYFGKPEETLCTFNQSFSYETAGNRFLRTGDLGFLSGGELYVTGREKEILIFNGQKLSSRGSRTSR